MSNTNVELIKSLYAAFGRGDIGAIISALSPDVDWSLNGRRADYPLLGTWKGPNEVQRFFQGIAEHQETVEFSPREFFAADDRVFVLGRYAWKLRKNGRTAASEWVHIFTIRGGKIVAFREFTDTAVFAEAFRG
jgi:ketosteroid isomerase-like protein